MYTQTGGKHRKILPSRTFRTEYQLAVLPVQKPPEVKTDTGPRFGACSPTPSSSVLRKGLTKMLRRTREEGRRASG